MPLSAPLDEGIDVDQDLADVSARSFKVTDHGEGPALPVLERVIERFAIIGKLSQPLPGLARVPGDSELCIAGSLKPLAMATHGVGSPRAGLRTRVIWNACRAGAAGSHCLNPR